MADQLPPPNRGASHRRNEDINDDGVFRVQATMSDEACSLNYGRNFSFPNDKEEYFYYGDKGLKVSDA